jgi:hypothetical protein
MIEEYVGTQGVQTQRVMLHQRIVSAERRGQLESCPASMRCCSAKSPTYSNNISDLHRRHLSRHISRPSNNTWERAEKVVSLRARACSNTAARPPNLSQSFTKHHLIYIVRHTGPLTSRSETYHVGCNISKEGVPLVDIVDRGSSEDMALPQLNLLSVHSLGRRFQ